MRKTDSTSPTILQKRTFNLFLHYLTTRRNKCGGFLPKSSYSGVRSVFVHKYCMVGETISEEFRLDLSLLINRMKRKVAYQEAKSGESLDEGKRLMSYEVYKKLCELLLEVEGDDYTLAHVFLTLEWNHLARSNNFLDMNRNHVRW